jgi:uncharacterized membrane protein YcaP (DUF421 family)
MLFNSWTAVLRTVVTGVLAYAALVFLLRVSGKRTLSKMNAFDLIVTVALGSTLATIVLSQDVALVQGIAAFVVLIVLQLAVTWLSVRWPAVRKVVKAEPTLLFYRGQFLPGVMQRQRVLEAEVWAAVRESGIASLDAVHAVVLETDGTFSVVEPPGDGAEGALANLDGIPEGLER